MTISSNLYGLSLADYLYGNKSSSQSTSATGQISTGSGLAGALNELDGGGSGGDILSLSPTAQAIIAQMKGNTGTSAASGTSGEEAKTGAKAFLLNFMQDSGVDVAKLSDEAITLMQGIDDMVAGMGTITRDTQIDSMTANYADGQRKSYTLSGDGQRMSFTVQYEDGKPASMTILHVVGTTATRAQITVGLDDAGKPNALHVRSLQSSYNQFGGNTGSQEGEALDLELYA